LSGNTVSYMVATSSSTELADLGVSSVSIPGIRGGTVSGPMLVVSNSSPRCAWPTNPGGGGQCVSRQGCHIQRERAREHVCRGLDAACCVPHAPHPLLRAMEDNA
jgi:hypothetical protein